MSMSRSDLVFIFAAIQALGVILLFFRIDVRIFKKFMKKSNIQIAPENQWSTREIVMIILVISSLITFGYVHIQDNEKYLDLDEKYDKLKKESEARYFFGYGLRVPLVLKTHVTSITYHDVDGILMDKGDDFKLFAVAVHYDGKQDILDTKNLRKSNLFDIVSFPTTIVIPLDDKFIQEVKDGIRGTNYFLLLIPNGVSVDEFETLRQARRLGVELVTSSSGPP